MRQIFGRDEEMRLLERLYQSKRSEFLAVYGRRRVGKTFLIDEWAKGKGIYFSLTGVKGMTKSKQLGRFFKKFCAQFPSKKRRKVPKSWDEALEYLFKEVKKVRGKQKAILFFDELPWLASRQSGFLSALDYYWNDCFSKLDHVLLIICGSAASWMIRKVVRDKGGLHNRLSAVLKLRAFSLKEVEAFLLDNGIRLERRELVELYMTCGGVAKYLTYLSRGQSVAAAVSELCFTPTGPLATEFLPLYDSLFEHAEKHMNVVRALSAKRWGLSQKDLLEASGLPYGGTSSGILEELEESDFILRCPEFGKQVKEGKYRLMDPYSYFYLVWIEKMRSSIFRGSDRQYWMKMQRMPAWVSWAGYAFENICLMHIDSIKKALDIGAVLTYETHWSYRAPGEKGVEIDLVIDRSDHCIHLCEMKFSATPFTLTKTYAQELERKKMLFKEKTGTRKTVFLTLITPFGIRSSDFAASFIDQQLSLDCLFH